VLLRPDREPLEDFLQHFPWHLKSYRIWCLLGEPPKERARHFVVSTDSAVGSASQELARKRLQIFAKVLPQASQGYSLLA
jgi:hypothetical protein